MGIGRPPIPPAISHVITELVSVDRRYQCFLFIMFLTVYFGIGCPPIPGRFLHKHGCRPCGISGPPIQANIEEMSLETYIFIDGCRFCVGVFNLSTLCLLPVSADRCVLSAARFCPNLLSAQNSISSSPTS